MISFTPTNKKYPVSLSVISIASVILVQMTNLPLFFGQIGDLHMILELFMKNCVVGDSSQQQSSARGPPCEGHKSVGDKLMRMLMLNTLLGAEHMQMHDKDTSVCDEYDKLFVLCQIKFVIYDSICFQMIFTVKIKVTEPMVMSPFFFGEFIEEGKSGTADICMHLQFG
jgi:hypothetical protein